MSFSSTGPQQPISHLDFLFPKDRVSLLSLLEARRFVEVGNTRLAAILLSEEQLGHFDELIDTRWGAR